MHVIKPICFEPTLLKRELGSECSLDASREEDLETIQEGTHLPGAGSKHGRHGICGVVFLSCFGSGQ